MIPMAKKVVLYGPPGIGKSTLIFFFKNLGLRSTDLEEISIKEGVDSRLFRSNVLFSEWTHFDFFGAANVSPDIVLPPDGIKILLLTTSQKVYDARRDQRDKQRLSKDDQPKHDLLEWKKHMPEDKRQVFYLHSTNIITDTLQILTISGRTSMTDKVLERLFSILPSNFMALMKGILSSDGRTKTQTALLERPQRRVTPKEILSM